jgi:hypothetical protein
MTHFAANSLTLILSVLSVIQCHTIDMFVNPNTHADLYKILRSISILKSTYHIANIVVIKLRVKYIFECRPVLGCINKFFYKGSMLLEELLPQYHDPASNGIKSHSTAQLPLIAMLILLMVGN